MRIIFAASATGIGYFPGLAKPVVIVEDQLSRPEVREFCELIAAARFFDRPAGTASAARRGAVDCRQYTITIEQEGRSRTLDVAEPIDDRELGRLVRFLEERVQAVRTATRPKTEP